ncbi:MAG: hypothetical protein PHI41_02670 [Erysipelotrichaceae bacterium]|nr:hypothetical protein [Erysipelotrichaceae bacterium]MDD3809409.1 hypothetical protein [Erysipelotrichaceae bacterium]
MDNIIQELVRIDHECANRVEQAKNQKFHATDDMQSIRKELYEKLWAEKAAELEKQKIEFQSNLLAKTSAKTKDYDSSKAELELKFNQNKDAWIDELVQRCLS